ncbi:MAG: hypothetical protein GX680_03930 [Bacteroidales bacterium]|nr:hypothetical protein [Bacteroidales bacterium]
MKIIRGFLLIAIVLSFTNCTNSSNLKGTTWAFPDGSADSWSEYSIMEWDGIFNPKNQYIAVKFIDDSNATYYVLKNGSVILETHNIKYFYDKDAESGFLILTNKENRKLPFKVIKIQNSLWLSSSEQANDVGIFLYKQKRLTY